MYSWKVTSFILHKCIKIKFKFWVAANKTMLRKKVDSPEHTQKEWQTGVPWLEILLKCLPALQLKYLELVQLFANLRINNTEFNATYIQQKSLIS